MELEELKNKYKILQEDNEILKQENTKLKEKYTHFQKEYYEKNKDIVNEKAKARLKKLGKEEPERLKEINRKAYLKRKEKLKELQKNENI